MAYWKPIRGMSDPIPIRKFDGVYSPDDEGFNLSDGLFTELINFCPDQYPAITTRPGYTVIGTFGTNVLGIGAWKDSELHVIFGDGSWQKWDGTTWTSLATGLSTTAEWSFCNFKGNLAGINLIGSNGVDPIKRYDGTTIQNLANAPAGGNYIDTQSNRLYCAVGNIISYSALAKADDWTTVDDAGQIVHDTTDGETINGLRAGNGEVAVFKPSSLYELYGKGPTSYALTPVAADIGATSNKAITIHDAALPFIGKDGAYQYAGGIRPTKDYSLAVNNYVLGMNQAQLAKCVAGTDAKYIYYGIPYGAGRILQYAPLLGTWYTWDNIAVTQMIRVGSILYFGDASGRVLRIEGSSDNGSPITATAIMKPFTAGSIARKTQWFKLWVVASIPTGSTLSVYVSPSADMEDWVLAKTMTADANIQFQKLLVPTNRIVNANVVRIKIVAVGPVTVHEITRQLREMPMGR